MSEKDLHTDDELKQQAPFLFGIKKEEPFDAPLGYFEKFPSELQDKIQFQKTPWWNFILRPVIWAPAMVLLIVSGVFLLRDQPSPENGYYVSVRNVQSLNELSFEVLDEYVNDHLLAQVSTDEIVEMVGVQNIPSLGTSSENLVSGNESAPNMEHVEEADMEEYLLDNIEEIEIYP